MFLGFLSFFFIFFLPLSLNYKLTLSLIACLQILSWRGGISGQRALKRRNN